MFNFEPEVTAFTSQNDKRVRCTRLLVKTRATPGTHLLGNSYSFHSIFELWITNQNCAITSSLSTCQPCTITKFLNVSELIF